MCRTRRGCVCVLTPQPSGKWFLKRLSCCFSEFWGGDIFAVEIKNRTFLNFPAALLLGDASSTEPFVRSLVDFRRSSSPLGLHRFFTRTNFVEVWTWKVLVWTSQFCFPFTSLLIEFGNFLLAGFKCGENDWPHLVDLLGDRKALICKFMSLQGMLAPLSFHNSFLQSQGLKRTLAATARFLTSRFEPNQIIVLFSSPRVVRRNIDIDLYVAQDTIKIPIYNAKAYLYAGLKPTVSSSHLHLLAENSIPRQVLCRKTCFLPRLEIYAFRRSDSNKFFLETASILFYCWPSLSKDLAFRTPHHESLI